MNAIKHGMTAVKFEVLPTEDAHDYHEHVDGWVEDLAPRNRVELGLAQVAAQTFWKLRRVDQIQTARLTAQIQSAPTRADDEVQSLGARLFRDPRGLTETYGVEEFDYRGPRTSATLDENDDPARLVRRLETTQGGVRWLIAQWTALAGRLAPGKFWQGHDKLKAARLLGCQPIAAADVLEVAQIYTASHVLNPERESAFAELRSELGETEWKFFVRRVKTQWTGLPKTGEIDKASQILTGIVDRALDRLRSKAAELEARQEQDAALTAACLSFDDSLEGERLRRYEMASHRALLRTLGDLVKLKRASDDHEPSAAIDLSETIGAAAAIDPIAPAIATDQTHAILNGAAIDSFAPVAESCASPSPESEIECVAGESNGNAESAEREAADETKSDGCASTNATKSPAREQTSETKSPTCAEAYETKSPAVVTTVTTKLIACEPIVEPQPHASDSTDPTKLLTCEPTMDTKPEPDFETKPPAGAEIVETKPPAGEGPEHRARFGPIPAAVGPQWTPIEFCRGGITTEELQMSVQDDRRRRKARDGNRARSPAGIRRRDRNRDRGPIRNMETNEHIAWMRQYSPLIAALPSRELSKLVKEARADLETELASSG